MPRRVRRPSAFSASAIHRCVAPPRRCAHMIRRIASSSGWRTSVLPSGLLINEQLAESRDLNWRQFAVKPTCSSGVRRSPNRYYRPETLASARARHVFLMPDRISAWRALEADGREPNSGKSVELRATRYTVAGLAVVTALHVSTNARRR